MAYNSTIDKAVDDILIYGNTAKDGSGTSYVPLLDADGNLQVDVLTMPTVAVTGTFWQATQPVSLASVPSHAVTNAGTFAVQVDGNALTSLQLLDDVVATLGTTTYTEAATKGNIIGAVRRDANTTLVDTTNEIAPLQVNATGELKVVQIQALPAGTNAIGKLAANSGVDIGDVDILSIAAGDNNIGNVDIVTVPTDPFGANADAASATGSISAKLRFIASTGIPITGTVTVGSHAVTNAGTFATQESQILADNAGFTDGTTKVFAAGYIYDEVAGTALTENDVAAARINVNRSQIHTIEDGVTRGRYATVTASNALKVDASGVAVPITDNSGSLTVDAPVATPVFVRLSDGAAAISTLPVSLASVPSHAVTNAGTFAVQVDGSALTALQLIDDTVFADDSTFTVATSKVNAIGMMADETSPDSVDEGDVGIPRMTLDRKAIVTAYPSSTTGDGLSVGNFNSGDTFTALTNTAQVVKASAGNFYGYYIYNPNTAATYVMLYNVAAASVTVGTTTPAMVFCIPATSGANLSLTYPIPFTNAGWSIAAATTGGGNTAPTTALEAMIFYK